MPIPIARRLLGDGLESLPWVSPILNLLIRFGPWISVLALIKWFFSGRKNPSERNMHGKVIMVTGATSGIGAATVRGLAGRGAQIVLLTQHELSDPFLVSYIEDLRKDTNNQLITAEQVDLSSLYSIRKFATKWIDNAPPRRLDAVVLCGNSFISNTRAKQVKAGGSKQGVVATQEGVEQTWQVNYLANFHLLSILSPALRAQPPDRDVRILFATCSNYVAGDLSHITSTGVRHSKDPASTTPASIHATSKLALTTFAHAFHSHLSTYARPDKMANNARVLLVDPGLCRTPSTRSWLTDGSLWGLFFYIIFYPFVWLLIKGPEAGAESFLFGAMEERFRQRGGLESVLAAGMPGEKGNQGGMVYISGCLERQGLQLADVVTDQEVQKKLWQYSEKQIVDAEKRGAEKRNQGKKSESDRVEELEADEEIKQYKAKVGKPNGAKQEGSRRNRKGG